MTTAMTPTTQAQDLVPADIRAIDAQVRALVINTAEAYAEAGGLIIRIRKTRKDGEAQLKQSLTPHKETIRRLQDVANVGLTLLRNAEITLSGGILLYQKAAAAAAEAQQRRELEKYEKKVVKAEAKAEASGAPLPVIPPPPVVQAAPTQVQSETGTMRTMTIRKWLVKGVSDPDQLTREDLAGKSIPDKHFILDTASITAIVKAGGSVPGVTDYEEQTLSVK